MVDLDIALAILGTGSCAILYLSPIPSIIKAIRTKDLQEISYTFLIMTHITPLTWIIYAIQSNNANLLIPNSLNSSIALIYILIYHYVDRSLLSFSFKYVPCVLVCYLLGFYLFSL
jgi:uncharacterized protein with PQ loop repeat